jgi:hypothetical protein
LLLLLALLLVLVLLLVGVGVGVGGGGLGTHFVPFQVCPVGQLQASVRLGSKMIPIRIKTAMYSERHDFIFFLLLGLKLAKLY